MAVPYVRHVVIPPIGQAPEIIQSRSLFKEIEQRIGRLDTLINRLELGPESRRRLRELQRATFKCKGRVRLEARARISSNRARQVAHRAVENVARTDEQLDVAFLPTPPAPPAPPEDPHPPLEDGMPEDILVDGGGHGPGGGPGGAGGAVAALQDGSPPSPPSAAVSSAPGVVVFTASLQETIDELFGVGDGALDSDHEEIDIHDVD